jgi:hypothetical protein
LALAVHTRTEGWLLLIPLLGWGACRWPSAKGKRFRLAIGILLCISVIPAAVTVVNVTWLRKNPRWEFLRTEHLQMAVDWWNSASGMHARLPYRETVMPVQNPYLKTNPPRLAATSPAAKPASQSSPPPFSSDRMPALPLAERSVPSWMLTFKFLERLVKGCTWLGSLMLLAGLVCGRRILLRSEHLTLFCMSLLLLAITRIRYWTAGLDLRYFMPLVIVGVPWKALGLEYSLAHICRVTQWLGKPSPRALRILVGSLIAVAVTCSFLEGPMSAAAYMRKHAALGRWTYDRAGPEPLIVGNLDYMSLEAFYSNGRVVGILLPTDRPPVPMPAALTERKADVVIVWNEENLGHDSLAIIERQVTGHGGYHRVDAKELPAGENELMVFVKGDSRFGKETSYVR